MVTVKTALSFAVVVLLTQATAEPQWRFPARPQVPVRAPMGRGIGLNMIPRLPAHVPGIPNKPVRRPTEPAKPAPKEEPKPEPTISKLEPNATQLEETSKPGPVLPTADLLYGIGSDMWLQGQLIGSAASGNAGGMFNTLGADYAQGVTDTQHLGDMFTGLNVHPASGLSSGLSSGPSSAYGNVVSNATYETEKQESTAPLGLDSSFAAIESFLGVFQGTETQEDQLAIMQLLTEIKSVDKLVKDIKFDTSTDPQNDREALKVLTANLDATIESFRSRFPKETEELREGVMAPIRNIVESVKEK